MRILDRVLAVAALIAGFAGIGTFLLYWDHTRIDIKRWAAKDPYRYERVDPRLSKTDPLSILKIRSEAEIGRHRALMATAIWGTKGMPFRELPIRIVSDFEKKGSACHDPGREPELNRSLACALPRYRGIGNLAGIDQVFVAVHDGYTPSFAHFRPKNGNGRLVIYHHGFAGTYHDQHRHIERLVKRGYAVMAFNLVGYGDTLILQGNAKENRGSVKDLRAHFEPLVIAVNYAIADYRYLSIDMIGLSAGGWATAVMAAMDPRIRRSYPVAGVLPVFMRRERETAPPQLDPKLLDAASYLDMFLMAANGVDRAQVQIFNRYDRCCFSGPRARLYEREVKEAVSALGPGRFEVLIDETHARHKLSRHAFDLIVADMERP